MSLSEFTPENLRQNRETWLGYLENADIWNSIPLLNVNEPHNFKHESPVRFRGMVQDMRSPEFYLEEFESVNLDTNEKTPRYAKYADDFVLKENEKVEFEREDFKKAERQSYVVISTPGLNSWVQICEEQMGKINPIPVEEVKSVKRAVEDEEMETEPIETKPQTSKKQCTQENQPSISSEVKNSIVLREHSKSFPLPERSGKKCQIILYDNYDELKLNDLVELVGFLSFNPASQACIEEEDESKFGVHQPPVSIVPRIHCVKYKKVIHNNPLVKDEVLPTERMQFLKKELMIVLTQLLLGDTLAAEYLICNLVSEVYLRKDMLALGKFCLNISNVPQFENIDYVKTLYEFIEMLVPKSHYFPMTLENMNNLQFVPKKDYGTDNLNSGILQLSSNTHLVLDETKLSPGKLNTSGVNNLRALALSIKNQKIAYDFQYYPVEYNCDIPFLILSEGKSMLTPDCLLKLKPEASCISTFEEILQAAKHFLIPDLLNELRIYLTLARHTKYEINDDIQNLVQQEFVNMRQNENSVTADDLHNLLVLARLVCISEGKNTLDDSCWKKACEMEQERKIRFT